MKVTWIRYAVVFALAVVSGASLMVVSHRVQRTAQEIKTIERKIAQEQESIRVLEAEWAFLNNPQRLDSLATGYLALSPPSPEQIVPNVEQAMRVQAALMEDDVVSQSHGEAKMYDAAYGAQHDGEAQR